MRIFDAVGSSPRSWDAAIADAVRSAKADTPGTIAIEVARLWADLDAARKIRRYRASVKIAYRQEIGRP